MAAARVELRWYVLVVGPNGDEASTTAAADPMVEPLIAALRAAGLVVETGRARPPPGRSTARPASRPSASRVVDHVWVG